tara:strand:+ start:282 stop:902 length:621 start_codon:yes stop_codon:yes gene_type:complete
MKLTFLFVLLFFSCSQKSKNFEETLEIANELHSRYFMNELLVFDLYSKKMKKEQKKVSLKLKHDSFCINNNTFSKDTIFNNFDSIFTNLNKPTLTEICFFSDGLLLDYYDKKGDFTFQITADSAVQYIDLDFIQLKNNVILSTPKQKKLVTNTLFWDVSNESVWTYDSIIIKNIDTIQGRGCGLFSTDNLQHYKTYGVEGKINLLD